MKLYFYEAACNAPYPITVFGKVEASGYERAARVAMAALMLKLKHSGRRRKIDGDVTMRIRRLGNVV